MALLRPGVSRPALASSLEIGSTLATRVCSRAALYSTDSTSQPSVHEVQALPRKRELRKVAEGSGSTAQLIGLAVKNTSERAAAKAPGQGQRSSGGGQQRTAPQGARRAPGGVAPGMHREELQRLLAERKAAAARGQTEGAFASGPSGSGPRTGGPRRAAGGPGGRPRPPRAGAAPGGAPGGANNPTGAPRPRKPAAPRRPNRASASSNGPREFSSRWSADELKPLVPPAHVSLSRANLAGLVKASALAETSQLRVALQQVGVDVDAREKAERDQARRVLAGDYSLWLSSAAGKKDVKQTSKPSPVEQARAVLSLNSTIPLKSREQVLDKIREATI